MPDRPDNPINNAPTGATPGRAQRVNHSPTHHHLDTDALSAFIDNRLEGDLALTAAGHIEACSDCRRELAELRATVSLLIGLPQYRPHRTFALGPEYAHPIRTSLFARFLPLLPRLQAATVACLLLLLVIGAGDVLTQIGDDSDSGAPRSSEPEQTGGDTAFESGGGSGGVERPDAGANFGDGTGGESGGAGFANDSGSKPGTDTGNASQSDELAPNAAAPPADDAPVEEFSEAPPTEDSDADSANNRSRFRRPPLRTPPIMLPTVTRTSLLLTKRTLAKLRQGPLMLTQSIAHRRAGTTLQENLRQKAPRRRACRCHLWRVKQRRSSLYRPSSSHSRVR